MNTDVYMLEKKRFSTALLNRYAHFYGGGGANIIDGRDTKTYL